ncbi:MAG TPA: ZPR1 zinc finger domain-containing protein [Methanolinea sp.]|nr:ZPR1 zinc finger domain-containing protein [Methanolinea sp.]
MRTVVPGPCPVCNDEIEYIYQTDEIPYFSEILIISALCPSCGYRFVDCQLLKNAEPSRWQMDIRSDEDLSVRVIRSMNATISIPELGVRIDPGPACDGFVSNVEGVLARVEKVVGVLLLGSDDVYERERINSLMEKIGKVREGQSSVTLIVEDPTGNSAILADRAVVSPYVPEDIQDDETGD